MRGLVVGCGSIGTRHVRNLQELGVSELAVVESDAGRRHGAVKGLGAAGFAELSEGLNWSPDFAIVGSPTNLHIAHSLEIAGRGVDLFIEKPLSHTSAGIAELCDAVQRRGLVSMVGCNMRFHPGPKQVRELIETGRIGRVLSARIHAGSYLPSWRPGTDYRGNYAAREEMGGGCILDCIHEIDLARWYLGDVREVFCAAGHLSSLEIETEDVAELICRHSSGALAEIHLDYVQRTYERGCQIAGEAGSILWDFQGKEVRWYDAAADHWTAFEQPESWQINQMYLDEMRHFLDCVRERRPSTLPVSEAAKVMQIVFAAKQSARERRMVEIGQEAKLAAR